MIRAAALLMMVAAPATAQSLRFDPSPVQRCLAQSGLAEASSCVGLAADACMTNTPGGQSTAGMGGCLDAEWQWWDARLNAAYKDLMALHRAEDAAAQGSFAPPLATALRDMQRAWIAWRDAACGYEAAQWGGGTGAGPASAACLMETTAQQAIELQTRLEEARNR